MSVLLSYAPPKELNPNTSEALARIASHCLSIQEHGLSELKSDTVDFLELDMAR